MAIEGRTGGSKIVVLSSHEMEELHLKVPLKKFTMCKYLSLETF